MCRSAGSARPLWTMNCAPGPGEPGRNRLAPGNRKPTSGTMYQPALERRPSAGWSAPYPAETEESAEPELPSSRLNTRDRPTQNSRSHSVNIGRLRFLRKAASWRRKARFSRATAW
jgi:hypothetical protein